MSQDASKKLRPFNFKRKYDDILERYFLDDTKWSLPFNLGRSANCPVVDTYAATKKPNGYTDAIHEALKKAKDKLPRKEVPPKSSNDNLPHQFTLEEWLYAGTGYGTPAPVEGTAAHCLHDWQIYRGLNFDDMYCIKCGQTRPLEAK